jgi:hypothetical protein
LRESDEIVEVLSTPEGLIKRLGEVAISTHSNTVEVRRLGDKELAVGPR